MNLKVIMVCGEKDQTFYAGQREMSAILDSAGARPTAYKWMNRHAYQDGE